MEQYEVIRCPHCHSTAQVKAGEIKPTRNGAYFEQGCECGCGCVFTVNYPRVINEIYIETIEKR